jgi:hypothetical protein
MTFFVSRRMLRAGSTTMTKLGLIAVVALVAGCSTRPESFRVSGFSAVEVAQLQSAADEWCSATNGDYCPSLSGGENTVELVSELSDRASSRYALTGGVGHVWVLDRSDDANWLKMLRRSFLHELGHNAGCRNELADGNVMAANEDSEPDHLTATDVTCAD